MENLIIPEGIIMFPEDNANEFLELYNEYKAGQDVDTGKLMTLAEYIKNKLPNNILLNEYADFVINSVTHSNRVYEDLVGNLFFK
jgi:hypothetical protein